MEDNKSKSKNTAYIWAGSLLGILILVILFRWLYMRWKAKKTATATTTTQAVAAAVAPTATTNAAGQVVTTAPATPDSSVKGTTLSVNASGNVVATPVYSAPVVTTTPAGTPNATTTGVVADGNSAIGVTTTSDGKVIDFKSRTKYSFPPGRLNGTYAMYRAANGFIPGNYDPAKGGIAIPLKQAYAIGTQNGAPQYNEYAKNNGLTEATLTGMGQTMYQYFDPSKPGYYGQ